MQYNPSFIIDTVAAALEQFEHNRKSLTKAKTLASKDFHHKLGIINNYFDPQSDPNNKNFIGLLLGMRVFIDNTVEDFTIVEDAELNQ